MSPRPRAPQQSRDESTEAFRALFERNPLPMWIYDSETLAFLDVNDAAIQSYGYTRSEFLRMEHPGDPAARGPPAPGGGGDAANPRAAGVDGALAARTEGRLDPPGAGLERIRSTSPGGRPGW